MRRSHREIFATIKTEGALLPVEILQRIAKGDRDLEGLSPESYHLSKNEKLNEVINRAWNRCEGAWRSFQGTADILPESDAGTTVTRERWLLILFQELGYGRLLTQKAQHINGKSYPISHAWHHTPIHLISFRQDLGSRIPGVAGAARMNPHGMVQEFLNRSDDHLWGIVSNGLRLRLLRDNFSLTRQAYVEFDLEAMMSGEVYSDFILLYMVLHQSRVEAERPEQCWLERWSDEAKRRGTRALEQLRSGVHQAIQAFGQGFLVHPGNSSLRQELQSGVLTPHGLYEQLLRLVYRLIFLFVAEDRHLLLGTDAPPEARSRYLDHYSLTRIRRIAGRLRGTQHGDLWQGLRVTFQCLIDGQSALGLSPLGGFLFSQDSLTGLNPCELSNDALLTGVRHLSFTQDNRMLRPVDYRNLGTEELGSVYESLLELHPEVNVAASTFELKVAAGSERKTTGSYYTPSSLISCLLDSALASVIARKLKEPDSEKALLDLKVVDPACGSGHFLIAAAHRIGKHLAIIRTGEIEPPPEERRKALRDVVSHCIYGVDVNPLAVELCKVALWIETLDPGRPLGFLDHRIKCGNSLIGATPELLEKGIPDDAFKPVEGDDKKVATAIRKKNRGECRGQHDLFAGVTAAPDWQEAVEGFQKWGSMPENAFHQVCEKAAQYGTLREKPAYQHEKQIANLWTAAFFWPLSDDTVTTVPTEDIFRRFQGGGYQLREEAQKQMEDLSSKHGFFHWHLEFPEVFTEGGEGGFDCVLGNPPWERIKLQEKEFFAQEDPEIATASNAAARKKLIAQLPETNPNLWKEFWEAKRASECESNFMRASSRYPLSAVGDINTYQIFAGLARDLIQKNGRAGIVVPSGIATDDSNKKFFADLTEKGALVSLYDFENREGIFPAVHRSYKFCLLTVGRTDAAPNGTDFAFFLTNISHMKEEDRHFFLSAKDISLLNPNTRTCPIFRRKRDAEITKDIYRRVPVLINESKGEDGNPWGISFLRMFDMTNDSHLFGTREQLEADHCELRGNIFAGADGRLLPLYEAKMIHQFDHRYSSMVGKDIASMSGVPAELSSDVEHADPHYMVLPRHWVPEGEMKTRLLTACPEDCYPIVFRDVCRSTDIRTFIACMIPKNIAVANSLPVLIASNANPLEACLLLANFCSIPFDFIARLKVGGIHLNFFIVRQLPCPRPLDLQEWRLEVGLRVLELTYTSTDMGTLAQNLWNSIYSSDGKPRPLLDPFKWDEERRFKIRCELDAMFFHIYGIERDNVDYIMETFPIMKRKDEQKYGEYRTKRVILECYNAMAEAMKTGRPYQTILDPPAADPSLAHPPPEDVTRGVMIDTAFPRTDAERLLCAATLELIRTVGDMPSEAYLDALYLATHPEHCEVFLPDAEKPKYRRAMKKAPQSLFLPEGQRMNWLRVRDYLEVAGAIKIADRRGDQRLSGGPHCMEIRNTLPHGVAPIIPFAVKAAEVLRAAKTDAQTRARVSDNVFNQIRRQISQEWLMSA
ncbi:MAG: N-6 DNA methylase [Deltaproteobacteria bacterium]|nr:N-6 DNA methylase [Deltaproteobacteria bacterium]